MLNKFRNTHLKKTLIGLAIIIIPAFVLWGAVAYFRDKNTGAVGQVGKHKISVQEYNYYIRMSELRMRDQIMDAFTRQAIKKNAWDTAVLLWKAKQERIKISDDELVSSIAKMFSIKGAYNKDLYTRMLRGLRISPRMFEEFMRDSLCIDKLYKKYINVKPDEKSVKELYLKDTQKNTLGYLFLPYTQCMPKDLPADDEIKSYYEKNMETFKQEATVNVRYVRIPKNAPYAAELSAALESANTLDGLAELFELKITESGFFGFNGSIIGIGFEADVNDYAFSLKDGELSEPIELKNGASIIIERVAGTPERIPPLAEITNNVAQKISLDKAKITAEKQMQTILDVVTAGNASPALSEVPPVNGSIYKKTEPFQYYEFLPDFGVDETIKKDVLASEVNEIIKKIYLTDTGAALVQVIDKTPFDAKDYEQKKEAYAAYLEQNAFPEARAIFINKLKKESNLKIFE